MIETRRIVLAITGERMSNQRQTIWEQLVEKKNKFIGGTLIDMEADTSTIITDMTLVVNGPDSHFFTVVGKHFSCGFDTRFGGIVGGGNSERMVFAGSWGLQFEIVGPKKEAL